MLSVLPIGPLMLGKKEQWSLAMKSFFPYYPMSIFIRDNQHPCLGATDGSYVYPIACRGSFLRVHWHFPAEMERGHKSSGLILSLNCELVSARLCQTLTGAQFGYSHGLCDWVISFFFLI